MCHTYRTVHLDSCGVKNQMRWNNVRSSCVTRINCKLMRVTHKVPISTHVHIFRRVSMLQQLSMWWTGQIMSFSCSVMVPWLFYLWFCRLVILGFGVCVVFHCVIRVDMKSVYKAKYAHELACGCILYIPGHFYTRQGRRLLGLYCRPINSQTIAARYEMKITTRVKIRWYQ